MHTENFYVGLELGMTKGASITKEAFWGRLWATGGNKASQFARTGNRLWGETASKGVPAAEKAGLGAFGSMTSQGWGRGMDAYRNARMAGQGWWDSARQGITQGSNTFNSMYRALSPEAQQRMLNYGRGVAGTTLVGGGAVGAGAIV